MYCVRSLPGLGCTYRLGTHVRDLEELPCKSLPGESVGAQMLQSSWALHWRFVGGNVVPTVQGGTYGNAALSVCSWMCATAAPLMLRHSSCSGWQFVTLDALYVRVCVCVHVGKNKPAAILQSH